MNLPEIGQKVAILSFKHDGSVHREWEESTVLAISHQYVVIANRRTMVTEHNGRTWFTREPAISVFFENHWFNVIGMLRQDGVHFYCNLSSPYVFDNNKMKYIDYDLDVKVYPDYSQRVLDRDEYARHKVRMGYGEDIDVILHAELEFLVKMVRERRGPFARGFMEEWYDILQQQLARENEGGK